MENSLTLPFAGKSGNFLSLEFEEETIKAFIFSVTKEKGKSKVTCLGSSLRYLDSPEEALRFATQKSNTKNPYVSHDLLQEAVKTTAFKAIDEACELAAGKQKNVSERKKTANRLKKSISLVVTTLPPDVLRGKIYECSLDRNQASALISLKEAQELKNSVFQEANEEALKSFSRDMGFLPEDLFLANYRLVETKIDGYEVSDLVGYKGKEIEFKVFVSVLPSFQFANLTQILRDYLAINGIARKETEVIKMIKLFHPAERFYLFVEDQKKSGMFLDIGANWTRFYLGETGKLIDAGEVEFGSESFTRTISDHFGVSPAEARFIKESYGQGKLSEASRERLRELIYPEAKNWFNNLRRELRKPFVHGPDETASGLTRVLPAEIYLFGGGSDLPEIVEILEEGDWEKATNSIPRVTLFDPKEIISWLANQGIIFEDKTNFIFQQRNIIQILAFCYEQ